jgi:two-component system, OmpR family, sensor histidine kinase KdpD
MRRLHTNLTMQMIEGSVLAVGVVLATTALFLLIGRNVLGEGVIALLYLVPIGWSTTRWGQLPGLCAALTAALTFDFFFIPPFYTFAIGSLEGWLILIIFFLVAAVIVGRIQYGLHRAHVREREALFMYELSTSLAGARTSEAVARTLARQLQQMLQAELVQVVVEPDQSADSIMVGVPTSSSSAENPDQILPMLAPHRLVGEIRMWRGRAPLPSANSILLQNFAEQGAQALERVQTTG